MAYDVDELYQSRRTRERRRNSTQTRLYVVEHDGVGTAGEAGASAAVKAVSPSSVVVDSSLLSERQVELEIVRPDEIWLATVEYISPESTRASRDREQQNPIPEQELEPGTTDEVERLSWSGEQVKRFFAYEQFKIGSDGSGAYDPNVGLAIDIINGVPRGVEVLRLYGQYTIQRAYNLPLTEEQKTNFNTWRKDWEKRYGHINKNEWREYEPYSAMFEHIEFSTREDGVLLAEFVFGIRPTRLEKLPYTTDFTTGTVQFVDSFVKGWSYIWTRYRDAIIPSGGEETDKLWSFPEATYVARVHPEVDFVDSWFDETW